MRFTLHGTFESVVLATDPLGLSGVDRSRTLEFRRFQDAHEWLSRFVCDPSAMSAIRDVLSRVTGAPLFHLDDHGAVRQLASALASRRVVALRDEWPPANAAPAFSAPAPRAPPARPAQAREVAQRPWKLVSFFFVSNLAPGKEQEPPKLKWTISDPDRRITGGQIVAIPARTPADNVPVWTKGLQGAAVTDGDHELPWDGQTIATAEFPAGYLSCEFSPYTLRLTLNEGEKAQSKEVTFQVEVVGLTIALGPEDLVARDADQQVRGRIGALPAPGHEVKVPLLSNLFKTSLAEMSVGSPASFRELEALWGDGPRIPIVAKVWFKDSKGRKVLAPFAWGRRKVLWDWKCAKPDLSGLHPQAKKFVEQAQSFHRADTLPPGENCHTDRGGKRASDGNPPVFGSSSGGFGFPFPLEKPAKRVQAMFSGAVAGEEFDGMSGVIFRPSRIAGDGYELSAYFDPVKDLDTDGAMSAGFAARTGRFVIWREIHLAGYVKKKAGIAGFDLGKVKNYYRPAFVEMEDRTGGAVPMTKDAYDAAIAEAIRAQPKIVKDYAIDPTVSQYESGNCALTFRTFDDFKAKFLTGTMADLRAAIPGLPALDVQVLAQDAFARTLATSEDEYANMCAKWGVAICREAAASFLVASADGVTILQFEEVHSNFRFAKEKVNGFAPDLPGVTGRSKSAFVQFASAARYAGSRDSNTMEQTISHEIGHHLFLPHAPLGKGVRGAEPAAHDEADPHCMMGYDYSAERKFCGLCLLRLRGWNHRGLDKSGANNRA